MTTIRKRIPYAEPRLGPAVLKAAGRVRFSNDAIDTAKKVRAKGKNPKRRLTIPQVLKAAHPFHEKERPQDVWLILMAADKFDQLLDYFSGRRDTEKTPRNEKTFAIYEWVSEWIRGDKKNRGPSNESLAINRAVFQKIEKLDQ